MARWKNISKSEADRLIAQAEDDGVRVTFLVPPECGGQIVVHSYAPLGHYGVMHRVYDQSDGETTYFTRDWIESDEENPGLNGAPA